MKVSLKAPENIKKDIETYLFCHRNSLEDLGRIQYTNKGREIIEKKYEEKVETAKDMWKIFCEEFKIPSSELHYEELKIKPSYWP